jgi:L-threonylcarbamoyladenylate synthase
MGIEDGSDPQVIERAAQRIAGGGLVAFATETVYGLGARADDERAVARIFAAKGRPSDHPLIVHVAGIDAVAAFVEAVPPAAQRLMQALWPGPVSVVLRRRPDAARAAAGGLPTLALRCPSHPVAQALLRRCAALGVPGIAAPSANRFGRVSPTRAAHVVQEFGPQLPVLDGGPCDAGIESAIVDFSGETPRLLRPGSVPRAHLEAVLGEGVGAALARSPRVSGSLASHYAPDAELHLVPGHEMGATVQALQRRHGAAAVAVLARSCPAGVARDAFVAMPDNAADAARALFDTLRQFDEAGRRAVCVEAPPDDVVWDGVRDRLRRAAAPR